jgi:hypothetical protein
VLLSVLIACCLVVASGGSLWLYDVSVNYASISYGFNYDFSYEKDGNNWFTHNLISHNSTEGMLVSIECHNSRATSGIFNIVLEFTNATFSTQTRQLFSQVNNSTVKFPMTLQGNESKIIDAYFRVNEGISDFTAKVSFESSQLFIRSTESNWLNIDTIYYTSNQYNSFNQTNQIQ